MTKQGRLPEASEQRNPAGADGLDLGAVVRWLAIGAVSYVLFLFWSGWHGIASASSAVGAGGLALLLCLSVANYLLRFARWQAYLQALGHHLAWKPSLNAYLAGFAFTVTPGKIGELLRGTKLGRLGVPMGTAASAFFAERLSDLTAVVLLAAVGLKGFPHMWPLVGGAATLVALATSFLAQSRFVAWVGRHRDATSRLLRGLARLYPTLAGLRSCLTPRLLARTTLIGVAGWFAEVFSLYLILGWLGQDIGMSTASVVFAVSMIAGALTFLPGGLGGTEIVMTGMLVMQGVDKSTAAAATVIFRIVTLWFAVIIGCIAVYRDYPE